MKKIEYEIIKCIKNNLLQTIDFILNDYDIKLEEIDIIPNYTHPFYPNFITSYSLFFDKNKKKLSK